jgi:general L-amino acid transport system permease protein
MRYVDDAADGATAARPPRSDSLLRRLFSSPLNGAVSLLGLGLIGLVGWWIVEWAVLGAVFSAAGGAEACRAADGACWAIIDARWRLILFGLYPHELHWRSGLACALIVIVAVLSCIPWFWRVRRLSALWLCGFLAFYALMRGGVLGLSPVSEEKWGGLSLTVFIFALGVLVGMPLSVVLALMRRSNLPVISATTGTIIDAVRSLPLVSIMFVAAVVLPLALPDWLDGDKLYRVILGFALFFAAYQAENIRSGIQALPPGQEEAAKALGLGYWRRTFLVVLPQAFRNALPPTINQFVIAFKETSLVIIVGFFDIMASGNAAYGTGEWRFAYVEVYVFIGLIYFAFVFSLSRYGAYLERRMRVGKT